MGALSLLFQTRRVGWAMRCWRLESSRRSAAIGSTTVQVQTYVLNVCELQSVAVQSHAPVLQNVAVQSHALVLHSVAVQSDTLALHDVAVQSDAPVLEEIIIAPS